MRDHIVIVDGDRLVTLYSDQLDLAALGQLHVERASHVEWDRDGWVVILPSGRKLLDEGGRPFRLRAQAIEAEVQYLQSQLATKGGVE